MRLCCLTCAAALLLNACGDKVCAGVGRPAIAVIVLDSVSGAYRATDADLLVYALDRGGARIDSVRGGADSTGILGAWDEYGPMRVVVRRAGYVPWTQASVLVRAEGGNCTTITEHLIARLQPSG
jgi:hypothetical protein